MSNCKVIALTNQKGGVGKTTTAVNLGVSLAKQGKKVLLIDADAQANLTMALGYSRPDDIPITLPTIMQDIIDDKPLDVSQGIIRHGEGVDLLPSNIELSGFEVRLINAMSRERVLKTYVNAVKKDYDYVLIDCMPSLGMITINALAAADSVVIPTQPHYLSAKGLELLLRSVSINLKFRTRELVVGIVLIHLCQPNVSTDAVVDEFNLHNLVHLADSHGDFFLREYKTFWAFDFTDNPCAIRYFLKRKTTVLCGYGSRNRCFLGKFSCASLKDADCRTAQSISVLIGFLSAD